MYLEKSLRQNYYLRSTGRCELVFDYFHLFGWNFGCLKSQCASRMKGRKDLYFWGWENYLKQCRIFIYLNFFFIVFQLEFQYSWEVYMDSAFSWITRCIQNEPRLFWLWYIWCLWFLVDLARNVKQHRLKIKFMGHPCSVTFSGYFIWIHAFWWPLITVIIIHFFVPSHNIIFVEQAT